jgi:cbb3-type cytochrome oxidase cytochrome c subunit
VKRALVSVVAACGLALAACGADDGGAAVTTATTATTPATVATAATVPATPPPQRIDVPVPVSLPRAQRARFVAGRDVATRSGCLGCHRIGSSGSDGIGSNLNGIGERRSRSEIRQALVDPQVAMPSYDELPAQDLDALLVFLSALGELTCPDVRDCG